jgi:hypothetical protein
MNLFTIILTDGGRDKNIISNNINYLFNIICGFNKLLIIFLDQYV